MKRTLGTAILLMSLATASAEYNPDWWKGLALEPTPTNDLVNATTVLEQQEDVVSLLYGTAYSAEDAVLATNLWTMLAALHGDIRSKKIANPPRVFRNFGIMTNQVQLQQRIAENEAW